MLWLTKWMVKNLLTSSGIRFQEVYGSEHSMNAYNLDVYTLKRFGSQLIQRGWNQIMKEDEHLYHKGKYEIIVNFELGYVCVLKVTTPTPALTSKISKWIRSV